MTGLDPNLSFASKQSYSSRLWHEMLSPISTATYYTPQVTTVRFTANGPPGSI